MLSLGTIPSVYFLNLKTKLFLRSIKIFQSRQRAVGSHAGEEALGPQTTVAARGPDGEGGGSTRNTPVTPEHCEVASVTSYHLRVNLSAKHDHVFLQGSQTAYELLMDRSPTHAPRIVLPRLSHSVPAQRPGSSPTGSGLRPGLRTGHARPSAVGPGHIQSCPDLRPAPALLQKWHTGRLIAVDCPF